MMVFGFIVLVAIIAAVLLLAPDALGMGSSTTTVAATTGAPGTGSKIGTGLIIVIVVILLAVGSGLWDHFGKGSIAGRDLGRFGGGGKRGQGALEGARDQAYAGGRYARDKFGNLRMPKFGKK